MHLAGLSTSSGSQTCQVFRGLLFFRPWHMNVEEEVCLIYHLLTATDMTRSALAVRHILHLEAFNERLKEAGPSELDALYKEREIAVGSIRDVGTCHDRCPILQFSWSDLSTLDSAIHGILRGAGYTAEKQELSRDDGKMRKQFPRIFPRTRLIHDIQYLPKIGCTRIIQPYTIHR